VASPDTVDDFLEQLASAAAAIMGAMGAALVSMVCNVTIGKKGQEQAAAEMLAVRAESETLRARLTAMVDDDIAAFDSLMASYKLPKTGDDDKARRSAAIQAGLRRATEVPLECARAWPPMRRCAAPP
jgi:formiminotetrahydrofolate cyclodeaminase